MSENMFYVGRVLRVESVSVQRHVSGTAKDAIFADELVGHKIVLDSGNSFVFGKTTKPEVAVSDEVFVTFSKVGKK